MRPRTEPTNEREAMRHFTTQTSQAPGQAALPSCTPVEAPFERGDLRGARWWPVAGGWSSAHVLVVTLAMMRLAAHEKARGGQRTASLVGARWRGRHYREWTARPSRSSFLPSAGSLLNAFRLFLRLPAHGEQTALVPSVDLCVLTRVFIDLQSRRGGRSQLVPWHLVHATFVNLRGRRSLVHQAIGARPFVCQRDAACVWSGFGFED